MKLKVIVTELLDNYYVTDNHKWNFLNKQKLMLNEHQSIKLINCISTKTTYTLAFLLNTQPLFCSPMDDFSIWISII